MTVLRATLPDPPKVELEMVGETRVGEGGFLSIRRTSLVTISGDERSIPFAYDLVDRRALDAAVMVAHHVHDGRVHVWLRSCLRPPVGFRPGEAQASSVLWELPAGLIEPGESPRAAATREIAEELGFTLPEESLAPLGHASYPAPGFIGELHHFFHVAVDPSTRRPPQGDGSPIEAEAEVIAVPLDEVLRACRDGVLRDEKTELALRRLAEVLT